MKVSGNNHTVLRAVSLPHIRVWSHQLHDITLFHTQPQMLIHSTLVLLVPKLQLHQQLIKIHAAVLPTQASYEYTTFQQRAVKSTYISITGKMENET